MINNGIKVGQTVEIGLAYDMYTKKRSRVDEATGTIGRVVKIEGEYALIDTGYTDVYVNVGRLEAR